MSFCITRWSRLLRLYVRLLSSSSICSTTWRTIGGSSDPDLRGNLQANKWFSNGSNSSCSPEAWLTKKQSQSTSSRGRFSKYCPQGLQLWPSDFNKKGRTPFWGIRKEHSGDPEAIEHASIHGRGCAGPALGGPRKTTAVLQGGTSTPRIKYSSMHVPFLMLRNEDLFHLDGHVSWYWSAHDPNLVVEHWRLCFGVVSGMKDCESVLRLGDGDSV